MFITKVTEFKLWLAVKLIICALAIIISMMLAEVRADDTIFVTITKECNGWGIGMTPWNNKSEVSGYYKEECHYICRYYDKSYSLVAIDENCDPNKIPNWPKDEEN